jgi:hypothetical protein
MLLFHAVFCICVKGTKFKAGVITPMIMEYIYFHGKPAWSFASLHSKVETPLTFKVQGYFLEDSDSDTQRRRCKHSETFRDIINAVHETAYFWPRPDSDAEDHHLWDFCSDTSANEDYEFDTHVESSSLSSGIVDSTTSIIVAMRDAIPPPVTDIVLQYYGTNVTPISGDKAFNVVSTMRSWRDESFFFEDGDGHMVGIVNRKLRIWQVSTMRLLQEADIMYFLTKIIGAFMVSPGLCVVFGSGTIQLWSIPQGQVRANFDVPRGELCVAVVNHRIATWHYGSTSVTELSEEVGVNPRSIMTVPQGIVIHKMLALSSGLIVISEAYQGLQLWCPHEDTYSLLDDSIKLRGRNIVNEMQELSNGHVLCRDAEGHVFVWQVSVDPPTSKWRQIGNVSEVQCMIQLFDTRIVTAGKHNQIEFWTLDSGLLDFVIQCRTSTKMPEPGFYIKGRQAMMGRRTITNLVEMPAGRIASAGLFLHGVRIWDIYSGVCLRVVCYTTIPGHNKMKLIGKYLVVADPSKDAFQMFI